MAFTSKQHSQVVEVRGEGVVRPWSRRQPQRSGYRMNELNWMLLEAKRDSLLMHVGAAEPRDPLATPLFNAFRALDRVLRGLFRDVYSHKLPDTY